MEYSLTEKGRMADAKNTPAGKIIGFMQEGHGVVNPEQVNYELSMSSSKTELDNLVKAGYLSKEEQDEGISL